MGDVVGGWGRRGWVFVGRRGEGLSRAAGGLWRRGEGMARWGRASQST